MTIHGFPSHEEIDRLSLNDPALYHALMCVRRGDCDLLTGLRLAVKLLIDEKQRILFTLSELANQSPPGFVPQPPPRSNKPEIIRLHRPWADEPQGA